MLGYVNQRVIWAKGYPAISTKHFLVYMVNYIFPVCTGAFLGVAVLNAEHGYWYYIVR